MNAKLTLSLKKSVIDKAKAYAKGHQQSLSQIVETYLDRITSKSPELGDAELDSLRGIINLPDDFDAEQYAKEQSIKKHG